ncbi:MAG: sigma 54-interacting transcriptional regulator [Deltaproteobacteria bacterium]|nr:sigma 54-interacting transcriptional regulator [Deltaproteobacteria bacterium]
MASDPSDIDVLRAIAEGTATASAGEFFPSLVSHLCDALDARYAFVAGVTGDLRARTLAFRTPQGFESATEWDVTGTPCERLVGGNPCHYADGVSEHFPNDVIIAKRGIESYLGAQLLASDGAILGYLCAFDTRPMPHEPSKLSIFRIFAARAAAELARLRVERTLGESEDRFRDLFDEAPIAYVHEDLESRFIRANRSALRILGVKPEEAVGTVGISLVPDTPDAQRRVREAFESIGRGTDTSGVVLELRRKDNGKPIWLEWWSRPDPSGTYTRTMFVDITDRVLMEQEQARLTEQNRYLREEIKSVHNFEEIIGRSPALLDVLEKVKLVAATDASVLITGETGTGKELIARAIHSASRRHDKPLIKLNCAALPTGLVESELFGHEKGAFSGAIARRIGRFELAHGGTIFLDEIGEVPLDVQVKLLRVLQEREFDRVGGSTPIKADVRVIAATNRDLLRAISEGKFRQDLYYRLNVFPVQLAPLRDRSEDIPLLVHYFVRRSVAQIGRQIARTPNEVMDRLRHYAWPGNIRELENVVARAVILSPGEDLVVEREVLPIIAADETRPSRARGESARTEPTPPAIVDGSGGSTRSHALKDVERAHIIDALRRTNWKIEGPSGAASALRLNPSTLRSRIKKLNIRRSGEIS